MRGHRVDDRVGESACELATCGCRQGRGGLGILKDGLYTTLDLFEERTLERKIFAAVMLSRSIQFAFGVRMKRD